ncbi:hypothetical protein CEB94_39270 [Streptomyces hawaiiensis]|uniref:Uncharacterized protein n=1 Tax=Streptomyces hawaiiensis TaxID=67305 RepID=A0A6G5RQM5_9ACTN|nr:hypothetical protein CEB94_39270 [Streptomyces hawaiiensis]
METTREHLHPQFRHWARSCVSDGLFPLLTPPDRLLVHLGRADRYQDLMTVARHAEEDAARGHIADKGGVHCRQAP